MAFLPVEFFPDALKMTSSMEVLLPHITERNRDLPGVRRQFSRAYRKSEWKYWDEKIQPVLE